MKPQIKSIITASLVSGIVYASIMAGFDYAQNQNFRVWMFAWNFIFFGTVMGFLVKHKHKKSPKKSKE